MRRSTWDGGEYNHVHFSYDGKNEVIKDISLSIPAGQTVAFVGPSGGGKTTLANLICRFFDPQGGQVKIGGVNVKNIAKEELMSRAGRDYLQTGFYTEVFFRQHGVHFVAIANSVDSDDQNSNEFAPFLNIMNEWYLRDLSRKQKTAI